MDNDSGDDGTDELKIWLRRVRKRMIRITLSERGRKYIPKARRSVAYSNLLHC